MAHRRIVVPFLVAGLFLCLATPAALAAPDKDKRLTRAEKLELKAANQEARQFRKLEVAGEEVERNTEKLLSELEWHSDLAEALAESRRTQRPLVWIHALGDLAGYL